MNLKAYRIYIAKWKRQKLGDGFRLKLDETKSLSKKNNKHVGGKSSLENNELGLYYSFGYESMIRTFC